jgi:hypothetical protein
LVDTVIVFMDIIHYPVFILKHISMTGFCLQNVVCFNQKQDIG